MKHFIYGHGRITNNTIVPHYSPPAAVNNLKNGQNMWNISSYTRPSGSAGSMRQEKEPGDPYSSPRFQPGGVY